MFDERKANDKPAEPEVHDTFLIDWGFDLLAAFRAINSETLKKSIISMIKAAADAERDAVRG